MWVNPKYRDQVEQPRPPQETGRRLLSCPRGEGVEFRINLAEYQASLTSVFAYGNGTGPARGGRPRARGDRSGWARRRGWPRR